MRGSRKNINFSPVFSRKDNTGGPPCPHNTEHVNKQERIADLTWWSWRRLMKGTAMTRVMSGGGMRSGVMKRNTWLARLSCFAALRSTLRYASRLAASLWAHELPLTPAALTCMHTTWLFSSQWQGKGPRPLTPYSVSVGLESLGWLVGWMFVRTDMVKERYTHQQPTSI